jgi:hypothetical protein
MNKLYRGVLRDEFLRLMKDRHPSFQLTKGWLAGEIALEKRISGTSVSVFVMIVPDLRGGERFTVEMGWSTKGRFPEPEMRPSSSLKFDGSEFRHDEFICRLGEIINGEDEWWVIEKPDIQVAVLRSIGEQKLSAEVAIEKVKPLVRNAVEKIERFGIPYLDEYLKAQR